MHPMLRTKKEPGIKFAFSLLTFIKMFYSIQFHVSHQYGVAFCFGNKLGA